MINIKLITLLIIYLAFVNSLNIESNEDNNTSRSIYIDEADQVGTENKTMPIDVLSYDEDEDKRKHGTSILFSIENHQLAESYDWSTTNNRLKKAVFKYAPRTQKNCGICWAITAATVMEAYLCIHTNKCDYIGHSNIAACSRAKLDAKDNGCKGQNPVLALHYLRLGYNLPDSSINYTPKQYNNNGVWTISCPVSVVSENYRVSLPRTSIFKVNQDLYKNQSYTNEIKKYLYSYGPAMIKVDATIIANKNKNYHVYYHEKCSGKPRHSAVLVGWHVHNGVEYWIIRNSWSKDWGVNGYFYTRIEGDVCNTAINAVFITNYNIAPADRDAMNPADADVNDSSWFSEKGSTKVAIGNTRGTNISVN